MWSQVNKFRAEFKSRMELLSQTETMFFNGELGTSRNFLKRIIITSKFKNINILSNKHKAHGTDNQPAEFFKHG